MKKYKSPGSWFSIEYPDAWHEFEDEAGSFLFYNPDAWTGNFRISANMDNSPDYARNVIRDELAQYSDAELVTIGRHEFAYSRETFQENGSWYTSHFWVTGYKQMVVYATFTCAKGESIDEAKRTLASLYLMNPYKPQCHEVIPIRLAEVAVINEAYERTQKEVKQALKKDFSSIDTATGIAHMQRLIDEGKIKLNPANIERLAWVLGCFIIDEIDGVEWVSVIDGHNEYPAISVNGRVVNPAIKLAAHVEENNGCNLNDVYEALM